MGRPFLTVFIPTFNRARMIENALDSVARQSFDSYEILVVDDGSEDDTEQVIQGWVKQRGVMVRYLYKENGGKHTAHNLAVFEAKGELMLTLDSDDELLDEALSVLHEAWMDIPRDEKKYFAGIEGLCITRDGVTHGEKYPADVFDESYLVAKNKYEVRGEKRNALRVDVLKEYLYPVYVCENHVRPSLIWKRISHEYKMRFVNQPIQLVEFAENGLTANASTRRLANVCGLYVYWLDDIKYHQAYLSKKTRIRNYGEFVRYALHARHGFVDQFRAAPDKKIWMMSLVRGVPNYLADLLKKSIR